MKKLPVGCVEKPSPHSREHPRKQRSQGFLSSLGGNSRDWFKEGEALGAVPATPARCGRVCLGVFGNQFLMFLRFFFPRALYEPKTVFRIGYPSDLALE